MKVMKWSAIALAVSAGSTQFAVADAFVSDQAEGNSEQVSANQAVACSMGFQADTAG
ncbi:hypothetical protein I1957_37055 [Pseudomonas aeruginosa]|nr:hypothetical protein [Pseudomonas aeruginosa]